MLFFKFWLFLWISYLGLEVNFICVLFWRIVKKLEFGALSLFDSREELHILLSSTVFLFAFHLLLLNPRICSAVSLTTILPWYLSNFLPLHSLCFFVPWQWYPSSFEDIFGITFWFVAHAKPSSLTQFSFVELHGPSLEPSIELNIYKWNDCW